MCLLECDCVARCKPKLGSRKRLGQSGGPVHENMTDCARTQAEQLRFCFLTQVVFASMDNARLHHATPMELDFAANGGSV